MTRITKQSVINYCHDQIKIIENTFDIDSCNGTSQLSGRDRDTYIAYGKMEAMCEILDSIESNTFVLDK